MTHWKSVELGDPLKEKCLYITANLGPFENKVFTYCNWCWGRLRKQSSLLKRYSCCWAPLKFIDLRVDFENIEKKRLENGILERSAENELLRAWNAIPENFLCLKNFATALLSMSSSTYACESLFSVMNFIKSRNRSSLTNETNSLCVSLKVTKYKPNVP